MGEGEGEGDRQRRQRTKKNRHARSWVNVRARPGGGGAPQPNFVEGKKRVGALTWTRAREWERGCACLCTLLHIQGHRQHTEREQVKDIDVRIAPRAQWMQRCACDVYMCVHPRTHAYKYLSWRDASARKALPVSRPAPPPKTEEQKGENRKHAHARTRSVQGSEKRGKDNTVQPVAAVPSSSTSSSITVHAQQNLRTEAHTPTHTHTHRERERERDQHTHALTRR